ncbi:hypothetical protein DFR50_101356 [Roseiarcus fermentans]|uniref:Uncharacterized protein n=1 Tax=Roseiarcus fermentans TaxID=1473586 RepID=A0A366FUU2_9HYPH|nr:hypothetical protein [Roseiarcus fermentans]RBP18408.1 hypothetical protein DFR50_101356 [Roseiarcus fermentans]
MALSTDSAFCIRLIKNEIVLGSAGPLARRYAKDGCWEVDRLDRRSMAALLAYACDTRGLDPDGCAEVIHEAAGLIGRDDDGVRARLQSLPLRAAVSKDEAQLAFGLVRKGVSGPQLATAVRRAKLGLGETPPFCDRLTLCDQGVVLGRGTVIAPLFEVQSGWFGLKVEGRAGEIRTLLSIAGGALAPTDVVDRLNSVSAALQRGDKALAEVGLALVGQPALAGRAAAEALDKAAAALHAGVDPRVLMKARGIAAPAEKASPDDPKHPGWPKGEPNGRGGQFRPKTADDNSSGPSDREKPRSSRQMTVASAQVIKSSIRGLLAVAESEPDPRVKIAALLVEVAIDVYPYVSAYFDPPKSLEELQAAAQSPRQDGYDDHHIVEQATANPDGSEEERMDSPDNLVRIPTVKHWELNRWYQRRNDDDFGGVTPRQYVAGTNWEERRRVGLIGLRTIGVLK